MNKIFKVIYSKTRHCYVVVSELAKSHCKTAGSHTTRDKTALTAAVLLALGTFSFVGMPTAQAEDAINVTNDYIGINTTVYDENGKKENPPLSKRNSKNSNYGGVWSEGPGAITLGVYAGAGQQTVTIGNNNRTHSVGSVYIGEHKDYLKPGNEPKPAYYVTSVGFNADAGGYGSIAIGSNAQATNSDTNIGLRVYQKSDENGNGYGYLENNPTLKGASVAVGYSANAADGNVAIGAYSQALMDDEAKKSLKKKSVYTDEEASSYVSVGGTVTTKDTSGNSTTSTIRRRISNVADGAAATDVATVGQLQALSKELGGYKEGFGIEITTDSTDKTKNKISLKRNLGRDANTKDKAVLKADEDKSALVIGGRVNQGDATGGQTTEKDYGALGQDSVTVGGADNTASGDAAVVVGGLSNTASAQYSAVVGGSANDAIGNESSVFGGFNNDANGTHATISGGSHNRTYGDVASVFGGSMNNAVGSTSSVFGGSINTANGIWSSVIGGSHNTTLGLSSTAVGGENALVDGKNSVGVAGGSTNADYALAAGNEATVTVNNGTAIGYQATANKEGTVAFGHDKGDVYYTSTWPQKATEKDGKYYDAKNKEITKDQYEALRNADLTFNDYSQKPTVTENKYDAAAYNRLVKVADGEDDHDVVVMEQLNNAKNDLKVNAGWGINVADITTKNDDGTETTTKNVISLNRNLGTNYGNPWKGEGKVTFEAGGENSLILGGAASILFSNENDDVRAGAYGKDSVLVGGFNNLIEVNKDDIYKIQTGEDSVIVGGDTNTVTGQKSVIVGGYKNKATGDHSMISGGASNEATGAESSVFGGQSNKSAGFYASVLGGDHNEADGSWASAIGGTTNTASGTYATTLGGEYNFANGEKSITIGGADNLTLEEDSTVIGGGANIAGGPLSFVGGGGRNHAMGRTSTALGGKDSGVNAVLSTGIAGGSTEEKAMLSLAAGYQSVVTDTGVEWRTLTEDEINTYNQKLLSGEKNPSWPGFSGILDGGNGDGPVHLLDRISTAVGYQATADAPGVIAFGHDKGDVASVAKKWKQKATVEYIKTGDNDYDVDLKYYDANHNEISAEEYYKLANPDGTWNDYTQDPVEEKTTYTSAYYNRLVKAADGIDAHDAVVMEQLKPYTKSNASNIGSNLKTYTVGDDGETITEAEASADVKNTNENAWGAALGTGKVADPKATGEKSAEKNGSQQLVTGGTVFNETRISAKDEKGQAKTYNYLDVNDSAGKNLEALDANLKKVSTTAGAHTALTVEGNTPAGTQDEKTKQDVYAGKNILLHESADVTTGKVTYDLKLSNDIMIGNKGKDGVSIIGPQGEAGKDGTDGKVGISGKDGKDAVSISGKDGVGHIGLTGPAGTNGKDGTNAIDITVKNGYDDVAKGINGTNGVDGKDGITRIVYTDKTGEHQVATLEDGLKFKGDDTTVISKKLNNTLDIIGGADSKSLTEKNIGVNSDKDGKLNVQLAKDLTGITSISNQTTTKDGDKEVTTGAKITLGTDGSVDVNKGKITNVGSGIEKDGKGNITDASKTNAANIGDVQTIAENTATSLTGKGLKFAANSGTEYTAKLGSTVKIQGTDKKAGHEYTADNLTTEIDKDGNITILMDKDMSVEKLAVNGKPGTPGSIGIKGQDGDAGIGIDGKDGISIKGKDGKDGVTMKAVDGTDGTEGHIGLTGPAGTNGKDGTNAIDITVKNGYDDVAKGINGTNGVDGKDGITRIVYTDKTGEHQVATLEDGLKFKGDDTTVIAKKLNNTLDIIGGADSKNLTDKNIGVNSDGDKLKVQLAKDLKDITSISNQKTTKVEGKDVTTGAKIDLGDDGSVNVNGGKITNVGSGIEKDGNGKYTVTDQNKYNAANVGDVQNIVNDAKKDLTEGANGLNKKANVDASNIGTNLKNADGSAASTDAQKANAEKWGSAIGTGKIEANDGRMVTGKTVYDEVRPTADGSYVKKDKTTGENLSALDTKIGSLDNDGNYIKKNDSISKNLSTLDAQVKNNADAITQINTSISTLDQNAVKYDNSSKSKITLGGEGGTTITKVKDGSVAEDSTEAVNGRQLWSVDQKVDANTTNITKNADDITSLKNLSNITDDGRTVIKNLSKDAVQVKAGDRINVKEATDEKTGNKTYTISANNNGTVAKGDGNLISGDTLYKEVHVDKDGSYIRSGNTVGQNLSALDSGLKTTSDLIHTNTKGDTIQIGGNSTATKIDVSGKDKDGNTTGRVITGIVTEGKDLTSAANVGYVNGITSANTQQIYRDMNNAYSRLDTNINRAAAGSNALAALHPLDFDPADKASFAVGYGHYHNANAAAIGAFYQPNANTMVNMGISLGNGDPGFNAGVSFKLGKGSAYNGVSKAEMAQTIHDQAEEISAIKANDAAKDKRIDALEKENQEMKKQIQEILSRLNG